MNRERGKDIRDGVYIRPMIAAARLAAKVARPFVVFESDVLRALHLPTSRSNASLSYYSSPKRNVESGAELPIPPPHLRPGAVDKFCAANRNRQPQPNEDPEVAYLRSGKAVADAIAVAIESQGASVASVGNVLDWGCSSGRVLRHFAEPAKNAEFWGVDVAAPFVRWAQEHISPPFFFTTATSLPHLPFEDNFFGLVYSISVVTHIEHLRDAWLTELRRVLKPGGLALLTIMDEHTLDAYAELGRPPWLPRNLSLEEMKRHDEALLRGPDWSLTFVFLRSDYCVREWGRIFDVVDVIPHFEFAQTAILLRKR